MAFLCKSSPYSMRLRKLREKNRELLDQLESNSALLERRLRKLTKTARTKKYSDKSWHDLPPSPLKRKYESWKARNYSGQVSAALNANVYILSSTNSESHDLDMKFKQTSIADATVMSPAKRSKQNTPNLPITKRKEINKKCQKHLKLSTEIQMSKLDKAQVDRCTDKSISEEIRVIDLLSEDRVPEDKVSSSSGSAVDRKIEESYRTHFELSGIENDATNNERERITLEKVHALIDYSPESLFLQRLKERAISIGDLISSGKLKTSVLSQTSPQDKRSATRLFSRIIRSSPVKPSQDICRPVSPNSVCESATSQRKTVQLSPSPRKCKTEKSVSQHVDRSEIKKNINRKRVCYRKQCYCRIQHSRKRPSSEMKENETVDKVNSSEIIQQKEKNVPGMDTQSCTVCAPCDIHKGEPVSFTSPLAAHNRMCSKHDKEHVQPPCCCRRGEKWFDELSKFRQSHWFDCHAYPTASSEHLLDSARNLDGRSNQVLGHKCIHKYTVDDRLNPQPVYADHHNNSRCLTCHLPATFGTQGAPVITLPSSLKDPEIQVSFPLLSPQTKKQYPSASGNVLPHKKGMHFNARRSTRSPGAKSHSRLFTRTIGELRPQPPPADSLALRYQKGVAK